MIFKHISPMGIELLIILVCMMAWAGYVINFRAKNGRDNVKFLIKSKPHVLQKIIFRIVASLDY